MKTQGEIEAAICEGISRFEQEYMGRGPKDIHAHLIGDLLVVRLHGVLTAAEQQLVKTLPAEKGRDLLKQVRTQLMETARPVLEAMVQEITGVKVVSLHHDISTVNRRRGRALHAGRVPAVPRHKRKDEAPDQPAGRHMYGSRRSATRSGRSAAANTRRRFSFEIAGSASSRLVRQSQQQRPAPASLIRRPPHRYTCEWPQSDPLAGRTWPGRRRPRHPASPSRYPARCAWTGR